MVKVKKKILACLVALMVCLSVSVCMAAGKTEGDTDMITLNDIGKAMYFIGYVDDYALTTHGDLLGNFRSRDASKTMRFFIDNSFPCGRVNDSITAVKQYSGTTTLMCLEGHLEENKGRLEFNTFFVYPNTR